MIARSWRASATPDGAEAYRDHFNRAVLPTLQRLEGWRGAYLLRRDHGDAVELEVLTLWETMEAVVAFAGPSPEQAVVEPAAQAVLRDYDRTVVHRSVAVEALGPQ